MVTRTRHLPSFLLAITLISIAFITEAAAAPFQFGQVGDILVAEVGGSLTWVSADGSGSSTILDSTTRAGFSPRGVAIAEDGDLIVTDFGTGSLLRVAPDGSSVSVIFSGLSDPAGVAIEGSGDFLVVIGDTSSPLLRIAADGSTSTTILPSIKGEDVEVANNGDLFVFSELTNELLRVAPDGSSVTTIFTDPLVINSLTGDMVIAPNGDFIITNFAGGGSLVRIAADGSSSSTIFTGLNSPEGIVISENGDFIVSEFGSGTLRRVASDGSSSSVFFSGLSSPDHIAIVSAAPIPEPSTMLLLGSGLAGLGWYRRRRKAA